LQQKHIGLASQLYFSIILLLDCTHVHSCSQSATTVCNDDRTYSFKIIHTIVIIGWYHSLVHSVAGPSV